MNVKLAVLVILGSSIAVRSSYVVYSPNSCVIQNGVEIDLAVIKFGEEITIAGLRGTFRRVFSLLEYVLTQCTYRIHTQAEYNSRIQNLKNQTNIAIMVGIPPTVDAIKVVHPEIVVDLQVANSKILTSALVDNIFAAVNLSQLKDYKEVKRQIAILEKNADALALALSKVFDIIIGNFTFSKEIDVLNDCIYGTVYSNISTAFRTIYVATKKLLAQIFKGNTDGYNDCLIAIRALEKKSFAYMKGEVIGEYTSIRNFYLNIFFKRYGILPGLVSLQAAASASSDVKLLGSVQNSVTCV